MMLTGELAVSGDGRIQINVPLRTPLEEIVNEAIRQAVTICDGNQARAARALDIGGPQVRRRMNEFSRSENANLAGAGHGASPPSSPGGTEVAAGLSRQDSEVRSQNPKAGDGHDG